MIDPEIQRAHDARVPYVEPAGLGRPDERTTRQRPNAGLIESYLTQQHTWRSPEGNVFTRPSTDRLPSPAELDAAAPADHWLMTAWNPLGNRRSLSENEAANDRLRADIAARGGRVVDVVATTPPDRSWIEDTLVIADVDEAVLVELALDYWQPALTALSPTTFTIVATGLVPGFKTATALRDDVVAPPTCPMRVDDEPDALCTMRGGPWISASIHAALLWKVHRSLLLSRLGCVPCADGDLPTLGPLARTGGPIALRPDDLDLASRYGGYVWR
ncbi:MAG: DUF3293 domain-containing protein [Candidatus Nanopelagicales bacterium]